MHRLFRQLAAAWILASIASTVVVRSSAADWPQFRGPTGDGLASATNVPTEWSTNRNIAWKVPVTGRGRSSPVLLGNGIWLTTALETGLRTFTEGPSQMQQADRVVLSVVCLDQGTGELRYQSDLLTVTNPPPVNSLNSYATPTPVVENGRLYCDFGTFGTAALDTATGKPIWTRQFALDHAHGPGSSPVVCGNMLILVRDGRDQQYVVGLDKRTGETVWKCNRPPLDTPVPEFRKSFSTPLVIEADGRTQVVAPGAQWLVSYEPQTGSELWRVNDLKGESGAPRPVYGRGLLYFSTGVLGGRPQLWAVRTSEAHGDVTATHLAWKQSTLLGFMPSPLLIGTELYLLNDDGFLSCLDAATGEALGKARLGGNHSASPTFAEGRIYCFSREGRTVVVEANRGMRVVSENRLDGPVFASPAIVDDGLYIRTDSHLFRITTHASPKH